MKLGVSQLFSVDEYRKKLKGKRVGLICNEASVNEELIHSIDLFLKHQQSCDFTLTTLFAPQHGFWKGEQDNMIETPHAHLQGIKLYSLYSETRKPTLDMLKEVDVLCIDLQDVGTRIYTYIYTMSYAMEVASEKGIEVIVLDRPNPIGGELIQGITLEPEFRSFVGLYPMPTRHGMTIGEIARWMNEKYKLNCDRSCSLTVVPMLAWKRSMYWDDTGVVFVMPSPNMPTATTALTFPGFVYFEGTQISEGRGTTRPLEQCGAPYIHPRKVLQLCDTEMAMWRLGCSVRETAFNPTFQKYAGQLCYGLFVHPTHDFVFNPVVTVLALMRGIYHTHTNDFKWKQPPYEYENEKLPFDVIAGTTWARQWVEGKEPWKKILEKEKADVAAFNKERSEFLMYPK